MWRWKSLSIVIFWWCSLLYILTLVQLKYSQVNFNDIHSSLWYLFTSGCRCLDSQTVQPQTIIPECIGYTTQRPQDNYPMQVQCWSTVNNAGKKNESPLVHTQIAVSPVLVQHRSVHCCLGLHMVPCLGLIEVGLPVQCGFICGLGYVPDINTMLGWFLVAHATHTMYVNSTLVYRRPLWQDMKTKKKNNLSLNQ